MSLTFLHYLAILNLVCGLNSKLVSNDGSIENENDLLMNLKPDNDTSPESGLNNSLQVGEFNIPVILDFSIKGLQNESRTIKINCRPKTLNSVETSENFGLKPLLERSICEFTVQEAMVVVGFVFVLLVLVLTGLFLCCSSGREETTPVAFISKTSNNQASPQPCQMPEISPDPRKFGRNTSSQVNRAELAGDRQGYY